jgi:hypothetical protein
LAAARTSRILANYLFAHYLGVSRHHLFYFQSVWLAKYFYAKDWRFLLSFLSFGNLLYLVDR